MSALALPVWKDPFEKSRGRFEETVEFAGSEEANEMTESELEREFDRRSRELTRQLLQEHLDNRGGGRALKMVRDEAGRERTQERSHERALVTTFGEVKVLRYGYGKEGLDSLHPLDGELNLPPERYSLELRKRVALEVARGSFEEAMEAIHQTTGILVPKRQTEELAARAAVDFDEFYAAKQALSTLEETGQEPILVMSVDGKGIAMRKEDLREATRKASETREHKLTTRLSKGEKRGAKRMATVASVYNVDRHVRSPEEVFPRPGPNRFVLKRPKLVNKRIWASVEEDVDEVVAEMFREAKSRDPKNKREWVVVVDGNKHQLRLIEEAAKAHKVKVTTIVDIIHVLEYVWTAGLALHAEGSRELEEWVHEHMLQILQGRASWVAAGMRRSATLRELSPKQREAIDRAANYLLTYKECLRYDEALTRGYPVASGVIEGTCRHLVNSRMNRSGALWSLRGADAILRLRALVKSEDFDEYWTFHETREQDRHHLAAYADRCLPPVRTPAGRPSPLRAVR